MVNREEMLPIIESQISDLINRLGIQNTALKLEKYKRNPLNAKIRMFIPMCGKPCDLYNLITSELENKQIVR